MGAALQFLSVALQLKAVALSVWLGWVSLAIFTCESEQSLKWIMPGLGFECLPRPLSADLIVLHNQIHIC